MKSRRKRKRTFRRLATVFITLISLALFSPLWIGWIVGVKLRSEIAARTNATLHTGWVLYLPPYTLRLTNARLFIRNPAADDPARDVPILEIAKLQISLAKLPLGTGPLLIRELDITRPTLRLIHTAAGLTAANSLINRLAPQAQAGPSEKLSDLFELRHVAVTDGQVQYVDQPATAAPAAPLIWKHLSADLKTTAIAPSNYHYQFVAQNAPLMTITSAGQIDIDSLLLDVSSFVLDLQTKPAVPAEQLPAQLQQLFRRFSIAGQVNITAAARIPLTDPARAIFTSQFRLTDGSALVPDWNAPIKPVQLSIDCYKLADNQSAPPATLPTTLPSQSTDIRFHLNQFLLQCDNQTIKLDSGDARFTPTDQTWAVSNVTGLIYVGDGPGPVRDADILAYLPINADGFGQLSPQNNLTFYIAVDNGELHAAPQQIPFQQITTVLTLTNSKLSTKGLTAQTHDGQLALDGFIDWSSPTSGLKYAGQGSVTNVNMRELAETFISIPADRQKISGAGDLRAQFSGGTSADSLTARGDLDIRHGHFFQVPVLKNVLRKTKHADDATVGEIAATFDISHSHIDFSHIAASSPLVGVQGNGRITFDDDIDMTLAVTPMSDWRKTVQETDIPILSDLAAFLAGNAEKATDTVVREAIDQFRVTGKASDPQVQQVPVPILNDAVRSLFRTMSLAKAEDAISKELRRQQQAEAATQQSQ